jgi:hypothetical protein
MSEGNYKVVCTSLEIKDPEPFAQTYISVSTNDNYQFEMATKTQTKKDMGLTRTVYHGQSIIKNNGTANCIPFFQYTSSTNSEIVTIGKIILEITDVTGENDNNTIKQLFQLIGTQQSETEITADQTSSSTDHVATPITVFGTTKYTSNFYLDGLAKSKTKKWIIDLNKEFTSAADSTTTASYIVLGLLFQTAPKACTIKIDAYTEVIS